MGSKFPSKLWVSESRGRINSSQKQKDLDKMNSSFHSSIAKGLPFGKHTYS